MAIRCEATTKEGTQCQRQAQLYKTVCLMHDEAYAEQRRYNATLGGKARGSSISAELQAIRQELHTLMQDVMSRRVASAQGAVCVQILNCKIRALEAERKALAEEEVLKRVDELETRISG